MATEYHEYHDAGDLAAIPVGGMRPLAVAGRRVVLCRVGETDVYAVDDRCAHAFAPLHDGLLRGHRLICARHGAAFDVRTGQALSPPATCGITTHAVKVDNGRIWLALR